MANTSLQQADNGTNRLIPAPKPVEKVRPMHRQPIDQYQ
jgi:hypothetical protein